MSKREELFPMFSQEILRRKELFGERKAAAFVRQEGLLEGFAVGDFISACLLDPASSSAG